jgi:hypothetical protein
MTYRITKNTLYARIDLLNRVFGYESDDTPRSFRLDIAYGGYRVARLSANGSGWSDVTPRCTARETYDQINALIAGAEMFQREHISDNY